MGMEAKSDVYNCLIIIIIIIIITIIINNVIWKNKAVSTLLLDSISSVLHSKSKVTKIL